MNTIELVVGGQTYAIACEEGEESHVRALGASIDEKFVEMGPRYAQNLLFAALQLADELHEARKATSAAEADKRKLQEGFDAFRAESADMRRDADTALNQRDKLTTRVTELEQELDRIQSAQQSSQEETQGVRRELAELREKEMSWEATENQLRAEIALLTDRLEEARSAQPADPAPVHASPMQALAAQGASSDDEDLPPALERFAQLLEETADKLEEKRGSS
ncbi:cell division protein ZapA [Qipengyuania sp. DSG2-2]|uniref:cell division protein ZapA n=1 Tax=Qipengyuania sp. DGS2-2 TaxID=3349631 RepID=UPI0036D2C722